MTIQKRSVILGLLAAASVALYGAAKVNSAALVEHVVARALIQKAPDGTDPAEVERRLAALLADSPDRRSRMDRLFRVSRELEKVQALSDRDLAELLEAPKH